MKYNNIKKSVILIGFLIILLFVIYELFIFLEGSKKEVKPFSEGQVLQYLEDNYKEKFAIRYEVELPSDGKDKLYVVYPLVNPNFEFYVYDEYVSSSFIEGNYKSPKRELNDNYTHLLVSNDLSNIRNIYPNITIKDNSKDDNSYFYLRFDSFEVQLDMEFVINYSDLDNISNKYMEVFNYLTDNISKYKNTHTSILLKANDITHTVGTKPVSSEIIKDEILKRLVYSYREFEDSKIYDIPASVKENYKVENIGYGNDTTKIYVNNKEVNVVKNNIVKMVYYQGCLKADIADIFEIIPDLKEHLNIVDFSSFNNIDKIKEEVLFAYEKDNNIYIVSKDNDRGDMYLYKYANNDIETVSWMSVYTFKCDDDLRKIYDNYFGIKISYDFNKEILHFNY